MNIGMIVIGTVMVAICALPFVAVSISRKKSRKEVENALRTLLQQNQGNASKEEFLGKLAIAIDESRQLLFFVKPHTGGYETKVVRLAEMKACKLDKESRVVKSDRGSYTLLELLRIRFIPIKKGDSEVSISLFNIDEDLQLSGELELTERWLAIIEAQLRLRVPLVQDPAEQHSSRPMKDMA